jgi:hypothetical protein
MQKTHAIGQESIDVVLTQQVMQLADRPNEELDEFEQEFPDSECGEGKLMKARFAGA